MTKLSKPYKSRVAYQKMIASTMTAQSLAIIRQIQSSAARLMSQLEQSQGH